MTKAKIIETIQNRESELWLEYTRYIALHAPQGQGYDAVMNWQDKDEHVLLCRARWAAIHSIMEEIGVQCVNNENQDKARYWQHFTWKNSQTSA